MRGFESTQRLKPGQCVLTLVFTSGYKQGRGWSDRQLPGGTNKDVSVVLPG